ncbi:hypothetical protein T4B_7730 [Trichinella pseudospiralis]|uniref:Uncharacterized protein n=2 Tax=Trichinella pseudospiralis TaxID=6337 RepID=A0A0V1E1T7_TRIPS|nr:hypothetical protein T4E_8505 [Trichinella pseudospiralis]KRY67799.1 hypothetical protein T4A_11214 [Trichinella pseudospiralis]KRY84083.1 hypothetical protein T4D_270 [Trichinella pseudospiralis]KRZ24022.1 hypothetical protein T4B_7730 [Trichinella pseudospiralis]KRZ39043.1 hypothetical protein T4C_6212 [Trichinella pseudospiralis]
MIHICQSIAATYAQHADASFCSQFCLFSSLALASSLHQLHQQPATGNNSNRRLLLSAAVKCQYWTQCNGSFLALSNLSSCCACFNGEAYLSKFGKLSLSGFIALLNMIHPSTNAV